MPFVRTRLRHAPAPFKGLSEEQRVLTEEVSKNSSVQEQVRRRAAVLLLLDASTPLKKITSEAVVAPRFVHDLLLRYLKGGLYAALLGERASPERRRWLALSPMHRP